MTLNAVSLLAAAAVLLACVSGSQGSMVTQMRYPGYYANYGHDFDSNSAARSEPGQRIGAFAPSNAERALLNSIDFESMTRREETRVFHGHLHVPRCKQGKYILRLTSSNSAHMFINGGLIYSNKGSHDVDTHDVSVHLKSSKSYDLELWWGNWGGPSVLKLEWAYTYTSDLVEELEWNLADALDLEDDGVEEDNEDLLAEVLDAKQVAELGDLEFSPDLRGLFVSQEMPTIKRCDYAGYFLDNVKFFTSDKLTSKFTPGGCTEEAGGVISMNTGHLGAEDSTDTSFKHTAAIKARTTGLYTFWVQADDGAHLYIQPKNSKKRHVVDNGGYHAPEWQHGSIFLTEGQPATMTVYYGNAGATGILRVLWEDPLSHGPEESFLPLL